MAVRTRRTPAARRLARLRERAEMLLAKSPEAVAQMPPGGTEKLLHEMRVYHAELELQNEELRRIQRNLEHSRDRYAQLYDQAPVGYLTLDHDGVVQEANLTAAGLLGLERPALLEQNLSHFVAAESQDDLYAHLHQVFTTGARQSCELRMTSPPGEEFTCRIEAIALPPEPGSVTHCLAALSDVTRQRQAETALLESRARLAGIIRSAMDAIIMVDSRQHIILFNEAAEKVFGWSAVQLMGQPLDALIPARFRKAHHRHLRAFGETGVTNRRMGELGQIYGLRADGTDFPMEASISQIVAEGEKLFTVILRDVTHRVQSEKALRQSEAELADFFRTAPLGLLWVGPDGRILRVNQAQLDLLGRAGEQVFGHNLAEFYVEPEQAAEALERLARKETLIDHRAILWHRDGSLRHVLMDVNGLWEEGRLVHTRWFVRDVSRTLELEREVLRISEREQVRLGQELHDDLCQQLTAIEFLTHLFQEELAVKSKAHARHAARIGRLLREANARARELSHSFAPMHLEPGGLLSALEDLARRTRKVFRRDCRVRVCSSRRLLIDDLEVQQHLYRIAQEAVGNAIKHGRASRIEIDLTANGDRLVLGVRDNGVGLPRKPRRKRGLGLHIMQYRAGLIGGSLVVQREPGGGTAVVCSVRKPKPSGKARQK